MLSKKKKKGTNSQSISKSMRSKSPCELVLLTGRERLGQGTTRMDEAKREEKVRRRWLQMACTVKDSFV